MLRHIKSQISRPSIWADFRFEFDGAANYLHCWFVSFYLSSNSVVMSIVALEKLAKLHPFEMEPPVMYQNK